MTNPLQSTTAAQARAYDARKERFDVRVKRDALWDLIERHLPADSSSAVLDLGGGTGVWTLPVARAGFSVVLTDVAEGPLERAREKIAEAELTERVRIEQVDVCDLGCFGDASFGMVLALGDPLSYCDDPGLALGEIHRVLRADGLLIADVENRYWAASFVRRARSWRDARRILVEGVAHWPGHEPPVRIREFEPAELRDLLAQTGFEPLAMYPSDLVAGMLSDEVLREVSARPEGLREMVEMEKRLREDPALLGRGTELQFVARRTGA